MSSAIEDDEMDAEEGTINESDDERDTDGNMEDNSDNQDDDDDDQDDDDEEDEEEDDDDEDADADGDEEEDEEMEANGDGESQHRRSPSPGLNSSPSAYVRACKARIDQIRASSSRFAEASSYTIEPVGAAPHSAHVHAMTISADGSQLITGGGDGYVRRYDVYASMNGKVPLTQNVRHQFVDGIVKAGVMTAWWANEEAPLTKGDEDDDGDERFVSPVHSLAVQQDALWCMSGMGSGNINLYSLRHDPGQRRHVLRKHNGPVSALALANGDTELMSGGWDRSLHLWDLNTGKVVRSFPGHAGQISSISFRPLQYGETYSNTASPRVAIRPSALNGDPSKSPSRRDAKADEVQQDHAARSKTPQPPPQHESDVLGKRESKLDSVGPDSSKPISTPQESTKTPANDHGTSAPPSTSPMKAESATPARLASIPAGTPSKKSGMQADNDGNSSAMQQDAEMDTEKDLDDAFGLGADPTNNAIDMTMEDGEELQKPSKTIAAVQGPTSANKEKDGNDSDGDSLFGGASADGSPDANGEADADGEADAEGEEDADGEADLDAEGEDEDAEGEDDDEPLAARAAARPSVPGTGLELPTAATGTKSNGHATPTKQGQKQRTLPKPAFGGVSAFASFDEDVSKFSNDIVMTTTLGGQVTLWDRRVPNYPGSTSNGNGAAPGTATHKGVRALALPEKTPPWCMNACWNSRGDKIYVGRRNETVDEWDLRMIPDVEQTVDEYSIPRARRGDARFVRSLRLPTGSGPVSSLLGMPNGRHLVCGSYDNVRLWDTALDAGSSSSMAGSSAIVPFRIVAGHHGAQISQMLLDASSRFLFTASGDRGWMSNSTEAVILHEVRTAS